MSTQLVERVETAPSTARLYVAGRILPTAVHEVAQLVDGLVIDADAMALTAEEVEAELGEEAVTSAQRMVETADGCVRIVAMALEQGRRLPGTDFDRVDDAHRPRRGDRRACTCSSRASRLSSACWLARPGWSRRCSSGWAGGASWSRRCSPASRCAGRSPVVWSWRWRRRSGWLPSSRTVAEELSEELFERGRAIEAIALTLEAGDHERATNMIMGLSESITDTVEPQVLLGLLARLGPATERQPLLLLRRATATRAIGRIDAATRDIDRAVELADAGDPVVRRRVQLEAARARLAEGRREEAVRVVEQALVDLSEGEGQTYARAYELLAECATTSDARPDLQRAAECYRVAAAAWEGCGEHARARACRRDLALGALVPLGRYDEALSQLGQLLASTDLSDAERSMTMLFEGFVLLNANRLESAESRFVRATDIGYVQENPRLIATAAWGRAVVASRRGNLADTLRWIAGAENTALSDEDDVLAVPFLCDVTTALGALGELELAERYLTRAVDRRSVYPDQVISTAFVLHARQGVLGDIDAALRATPPADWWRVKLVAAYAAARGGDLEQARPLLEDAQRELLALGFSDAASLGEGRIHQELHTMLQRPPVGEERIASLTRRSGAPEPEVTTRLAVIGESMTVYHAGQRRPCGSPVATPNASSGWSSHMAARPPSTSSAKRSGLVKRWRPAGLGCATC